MSVMEMGKIKMDYMFGYQLYKIVSCLVTTAKFFFIFIFLYVSVHYNIVCLQ